jgi:hypothetical protein
VQTASAEDLLFDQLAEWELRPYDFVYGAFPWGEAGSELSELTGPDEWQKRVLWDLQEGLLSGKTDLAAAFEFLWQIAIRSGHGVGKSALFSWLIMWGIATKSDTRGRVTANTKEQLMRVLWGELAKWHRLSICRHLFKVTATAIFSADPVHEKTWRIDAIPWSAENPEAFAGLHNYGKRIMVLCDEASAIDDVIWEVLDGATTDMNTQIIWIVAGNPTRNAGRFRDCWDKFGADYWESPGRSREPNPYGTWHCYKVNGWDSALSNKSLYRKWRSSWGEESDFYRIRVLGEFPNASTTQLIPLEIIQTAGVREVQSFHWEPLILGVDIARFGNNETVAQFRRGRDARTMPAARWRNLPVDQTADRIAALISQFSPDAVFIDEGGVGGGVVDFLRRLGHSVIPVNFGVPASQNPAGTLVANKRAEMFVMLRDWLSSGGCVDPSGDLSDQLISIEYHYNKKQEIQLMSKEDMRSIGKDSPDWGDALALTFAYPVSKRNESAGAGKMKVDYDPLGDEAMPGYRAPSRPMVYSQFGGDPTRFN